MPIGMKTPFPASARYLDPYNGFGFGGAVAAGIVGFGGFGQGMGYLMAPLNYDLQVIQQIEMNEMVRMSNYSFEIKNAQSYENTIDLNSNPMKDELD